MHYAWKVKAGTQGAQSAITLHQVVVASSLKAAVALILSSLDEGQDLTHLHISRVGPMEVTVVEHGEAVPPAPTS